MNWMSELNNLLDGALEEFRDSPAVAQIRINSSSTASSFRTSMDPKPSPRPHKGFEFQFDGPSLPSPPGRRDSAYTRPCLPPKPVHRNRVKAAASKRLKSSGSAHATSTTKTCSGISATLKALAQPNPVPLTVTNSSSSQRASVVIGSRGPKPELSDVNSGAREEDLEAVMRELAAQLTGEDILGPDRINTFVDGLLQQLLSKQVLHRSMQNIGSRYPAWLEKHSASLSSEDLGRYKAQHQHIIDICQLYETSPDDFGRIYDKLQQMQSCGTPPKEIVNELTSGLIFDDSGLPQLPGNGCPMQ